LCVDDFAFCLGVQFSLNVAALLAGIGERYSFLSSPFLTRNNVCAFFSRVYIFCVRIWRSTLAWSSLGVVRLFVVVDAAFVSYGQRVCWLAILF